MSGRRKAFAIETQSFSVGAGSRLTGTIVPTDRKTTPMTLALRLAARLPALALLPIAVAAPAAAQDGSAQVYDALFDAYFDGQAIDAYPEFEARLVLVDHIASILKDTPDLKGWTETDTADAITTFGAPIRAPYKIRVADRLRTAISPEQARAATGLAADPVARKTIKCAARRTSRAASEWAACAAQGGRAFSAGEQALATSALDAVNAAVVQPDLNSTVVGIVCHTLDRFSDRVSTDEMTRKYSMTISLVRAEKPIACDRAKSRYAALAGHDAYLKLEPSLTFESDAKGE